MLLINVKETFAKMNLDDQAEQEVNKTAPAKEEQQNGIDGFNNMIIRKALSLSTGDILKLSAEERQQILDDPNTRHNNIYLHWPRDPGARKVLRLDDVSGKKTPNGLEMWGSTRLDFYMVALSEKKPNVVISSSGSKLGAWMKANGEDKYGPATVLMRRAETGEEPELIYPCDIAQLIKDGEANNPFTRLATIQQYFPHAHLPQKLVVHDPWKLLQGGDPTKRPNWEEEKRISWSKMVDIKHVYKLTTSSTNTSRKALDDKEVEEVEQKLQRDRLNFLVNVHTDVSCENVPTGMQVHIETPKPGPAKPPVYIVLPVIPARRVPTEAHLYLSPREIVSQGEHSVMYKAEWELPRNVLVDEYICHTCMLEDTTKILAEQDGENRERRDPKWDVLSGAFIPDEELTEDGKIAIMYRGPFRPIESRVQFQDLAQGPYCIHMRKTQAAIHPLTAKVYVAAKLSTGEDDDERLTREAENYQAFPRHFFEHWCGYNLVPPLEHPVPVAPLVPQFYGYYVASDLTEKKNDEYLSPILLQEYCGRPSNPAMLSADDQYVSHSSS